MCTPKSIHAALTALLEVLRECGVITVLPKPTGLIVDELRNYDPSMREARGLADGTRRSSSSFFRVRQKSALKSHKSALLERREHALVYVQIVSVSNAQSFKINHLQRAAFWMVPVCVQIVTLSTDHNVGLLPAKMRTTY